MRKLLEILLGIDPSDWAGAERYAIEWAGAPGGDRGLLALLGTAVCLGALYFLYRRDGRALSRRVRLLLTALRVMVVAGIIIMLLEPVLVLHITKWEQSRLLVLVDQSASMGFRDDWGDAEQAARIAEVLRLEGDAAALRKRSRIELARHLLQGGMLEQLSAEGARLVKLHRFADRLDPGGGVVSVEALEAGSGSTAVGTAIRDVLAAYRGQHVAGLVLISDGQSNTGILPSKAAEYAGQAKVPIAVLAAGTPEGPRNAAIDELETSDVAFVRDPIELRAVIRARGMDAAPAVVVLESRDTDSAQWEPIERRRIMLGEGGGLQTVVFEYLQDAPTELDFRVTLETGQSEMDPGDNVATRHVRVISRRVRVLFIAGNAFPEVQFLRNALWQNDRTIELSSWLQTADDAYSHLGHRPIRRLPVSQAELNRYDCVVLYDPDPSLWPPHFPQLLGDFVAQAGGGLIYIAGEGTGTALFDRSDDEAVSSLVEMLPVVRDPGLFRTAVDVRISSREAWKLYITPEGRADLIFRFHPDPQRNKRIVDQLPGMYWHLPVTRAKPGATVLARHGDPRMRNQYGAHVLLATHLYGPGRTFFVGFDSTYRWRYLDEQYFRGFWARMIDRAGRTKQLGGNYPFRLSTDQATYRPGTQVTLIARFIDSHDVGPGLEVLHGQLEHGSDPPRPLTLSRDDAMGEAGVFNTSFTVDRRGPYVVKVWPGETAIQGAARAATHQFEVRIPDLEQRQPVQDRLTLQAIADASGGRVFDLDEAASLPDLFKTKKVAIPQPFRDPIWDAPALWGTILLLAFVEWVLRKRYRLV